ncbi:hypothetical protein GUA46_03950 [Muricauda sp. HICW]|uniref:Lipoprotein n=1 Tax=Flagellimonas chongwuensis TaxID=2697365 RepID=A0A850NGB1_9FLAO|nr:hypothetical protein [Allomuricauda chongwuensis]NVN17485.1 hypothetical protein [Allomuricauda chongwuensis]
MQNRLLILFFTLLAISILFSCNENKSYQFQEPYLNHAILLDLNSSVKKVIYERKILSPTEGGYFPSVRNKEHYSKFIDYPYSSSDFRYMGNLNINMINNLPITANQYFLNELILMDMESYDVSIQFKEGKITSYSCKVDGNTNTLKCIYNDENKLIELHKNSFEKIRFHHKGNFLKKITIASDVRNDSITFNHKLIQKNHIQISKGNEQIDVYLKTDPNEIIPSLSKIVSKTKNETIKYSKGKLQEAFKESNNNLDSYKGFAYQGDQIKSMLRNDNEKSIVKYSLDNKNNIIGINIDTDYVSDKSLDLNFQYEYNNQGDWTIMSFSRSREVFDQASRNMNEIESKLLRLGFKGPQLVFNKYYMEAKERVEFAKLYCSKTIIERNIEY